MHCDYTYEELIEAKKQLDSTLHKTKEVLKTFLVKENPDRYKSQINLTKRRIKAFEIALTLIEAEAGSLITKDSQAENF
jgi:hypothetical protein